MLWRVGNMDAREWTIHSSTWNQKLVRWRTSLSQWVEVIGWVDVKWERNRKRRTVTPSRRSVFGSMIFWDYGRWVRMGGKGDDEWRLWLCVPLLLLLCWYWLLWSCLRRSTEVTRERDWRFRWCGIVLLPSSVFVGVIKVWSGLELWASNDL